MGTMARRADMSMAEACTQVNEAQGTGEDGGRRSGEEREQRERSRGGRMEE